MKWTQTCFTKRGLEVSGWPKHIFISRGEKSAAMKKVCVCLTEEEHTSNFLLIMCFCQKLRHPEG